MQNDIRNKDYPTVPLRRGIIDEMEIKLKPSTLEQAFGSQCKAMDYGDQWFLVVFLLRSRHIRRGC